MGVLHYLRLDGSTFEQEGIGVTGIYCCEIPFLVSPLILYKNVFIAVYTARITEWYM